MSDTTPKLIETILGRLELSEQARLEAEVENADLEAQEQEKRLKIEVRLVETGQQVRDRMLEHYGKRFSRRANWFGRRVLKLGWGYEPSLEVILKNYKEKTEGVTEHAKRMEILKSQRQDYDEHVTLTTPLLMAEPGPVAGPYRFELGWKFGLKDCNYADSSTERKVDYSWRRSPLYIYRSAREVHSGDEADELAYAMYFPGDMYTQKEPELKSFTEGVEDDQLTLTGKDAHLHVLGLMQEGLKELSFKRRK